MFMLRQAFPSPRTVITPRKNIHINRTLIYNTIRMLTSKNTIKTSSHYVSQRSRYNYPAINNVSISKLAECDT